MAGIYIKGMEMPQEGTFNIVHIYSDGRVSLPFWGKGMQVAEGIEAVPVPDHGRLVDADALVLKGYALSVIRSGSYGTWRDDVPLIDTDAAPTIIPADKDGDA